MLRRLTILSLVLVFIFASCEDKKSSANTKAESSPATTKVTEKQKDSAAVAEQKVQDSIKKAEAEKKKDPHPIAQEELIPFLTKYGKENPENKIRIKTKFGNIDVTLYRDTPLHRANFIMLTKNGYFDDTYFHRVAPGFVIQGGNSDNRSTAHMRHENGSYLIPSEFDAGHKHNYGAFSMAKYSEQNVSKASSPYEFFIVMDPNGAHHLDNEHTVFGYVTDGMDVAEKISHVKTGQSEWPIDNVEMNIDVVE